MGAAQLSLVQGKGQVTIPVEIRKRLGLKKGDLVAFVETDQGVLITAQEVIAMDALEKIGAMLKERGVTLEELVEAGRDVRGNISAREYGLRPDQ